MNDVDSEHNRQETNYDANNRLPLQLATSRRHIVFSAGDVEHDAKEGGTNGGHDRYRYVKSELTLYTFRSRGDCTEF